MLARRAFIGAVLAGALAPFPAAGAEDAAELLRAHRARHRTRDEHEVITMTLTDRGGAVKQRRIARYVLSGPDDLDKILVRFLAPRDVENTAVLTWEGKDGRDDQWLYLPSLRKTKRVAASGKKNKFMGTEFAFEDLLPEAVALNRYALAGRETVDGHDCAVVEARPASDRQAEESGYSRRRLWLRTDTLVIVRREFYDKRGKLEKTQHDRGWMNVKGTAWRASEIEMASAQTGARTVLRVDSRTTDGGLSPDFFTEAELLRGAS